MVTASTALTIFIMNIHHCGPDAKPVPRWAKKVILQYLARMCFVYEVGENCLTPPAERQEPAATPPPPPPPPPPTRSPNWTMNGQAGPPGRDNRLQGPERDAEGVGSKAPPEWGREDADRPMSRLGSVGLNPTNQYTSWKNGVFQSMDCGGGDSPGAQRRGRVVAAAAAVSDGERREREQQLLRNVEYIANCYRDQRATQKRTGEWKKVAKVLDRFFMWVFFIMVFLMSLLIMGKVV